MFQNEIEFGLQLYQTGNLQKARVFFENLIKKTPNNYEILQLLGVLNIEANEPENAIKYLEMAISLNQHRWDFYLNLGIARERLGHYQEALNALTICLKLNPDEPEGYFNRGNIFAKKKDFISAIEEYKQVLIISKDNFWALINIANSYLELEYFSEAIYYYEQAIYINSNNADVYFNLGNLLFKNKRFEEALNKYNMALEIKPAYPEVLLNKGKTYFELKKFQEAIDCYIKASEYKNDYKECFYNTGIALTELLKINEAIKYYDLAIKIDSNYVDAIWNKSLLLLLLGKLNEGFLLYEVRFERAGHKDRSHIKKIKENKLNYSGKKILIRQEQGIGDVIQFYRYVQELVLQGAKITLEVNENLHHLFTFDSGVKCVTEEQKEDNYDYWAEIMSLPLVVNSDSVHKLTGRKYIKTSKNYNNKWGNKIGNSRKKIGIVWKGNSTHKRDSDRSIGLVEFLKILPLQLDYYSLQKDVSFSEAIVLEEYGITQFGELISNFSDTASICELLDVVVTVDTSVAHLAASLGVRTWILISYIPDWRWMLNREDSPWYESVKLYRQGADRQWGSVLQRVANDLIELDSMLN